MENSEIKKEHLKYIVFSILILLVIPFASAGFFDFIKDNLITGFQTTTFEVSIPTLNFMPNVTLISLNSSETVTAGGLKNLNFSFVAEDINGAGDLNTSSIIANITFTYYTNISRDVRNATCIVAPGQVGMGANQRNYSCVFTGNSNSIFFFDPPGSWNVAVSIADNGSNFTINSSQWFSIQQTISINRTDATVNFPAVSLGENNVTSSNDPNSVQNIGNKNQTILNLTAINLIGDSDSSSSTVRIDAINFTTNYITNAAEVECHYNASAGSGGARLTNNTMISINISILRGPDRLNDTYFCLLHAPGNLLSQTYSTGGTPDEPDWTFTAG